jgi:hypothetical protein
MSNRLIGLLLLGMLLSACAPARASAAPTEHSALAVAQGSPTAKSTPGPNIPATANALQGTADASQATARASIIQVTQTVEAQDYQIAMAAATQNTHERMVIDKTLTAAPTALRLTETAQVENWNQAKTDAALSAAHLTAVVEAPTATVLAAEAAVQARYAGPREVGTILMQILAGIGALLIGVGLCVVLLRPEHKVIQAGTQTLVIEKQKDHSWQIADLPLHPDTGEPMEDELFILARGVLEQKAGFSEEEWTGLGKPFSKRIYHPLRYWLEKNGIVQRVANGSGGFVLTDFGRHVLETWFRENFG